MAQRTIPMMDFRHLVGQDIATSDWVTITQARIDLFASATDDHQWIHTDAERAASELPYGGTIAHGFLILSMIVPLFEASIAIEGSKVGINYGLNRVRFTSSVRSGSRIRGRFALKAFKELSPGVELTWSALVDLEGEDKPACIVEWITRRYP